MGSHELDDALREQLPGLRRYALWLTRESASADDLVQTSLEKALSRWHSRREEASLRPWLFSILYRSFLDSRRSARRYARMLEFFGAHEPEQRSPEYTVAAETALKAFDSLPDDQRHLLYWVSVEGLSYKEVADILNVPIGTVMSRLSRARQALRQLSDGTPRAVPALRLLK
ncbi:sigma-70 family RNA polymerase sigma factor [Pseudomonas sp. Marseille-QA0892]